MTIHPERGLFNQRFGPDATTGPIIRTCVGTPEGALAEPVGSLAFRLDGGTSTTLYVKETGAATSTGWVAK